MQQTETYYGLTQSQSLIWTGQRISPDAPMYNMALAFHFKAPIEVHLFRKAFSHLVDNCDVMRTVFSDTESQPQQKFAANISYDLPLVDLTDKKETLESWLTKRSQRPFDIEKCLFDGVLLKLDNNNFVWYFNQHHLITDAWAMTLQYKFVAEVYNKLVKGESIEGMTLPSFSNYVDFESQQGSKKAVQDAKKYWKEKLTSLPSPPRFFNKNNAELSTQSPRFSVTLKKEKVDLLRQLTKEADLKTWTDDLSLFCIFSTLLITYINRITDQQKITIGTPAHNRTNNTFKQTPGLFIELFPISAEVKTEDNFSTLYKKLLDETLLYLRYAQAGVSSHQLSRSFNVVLNYINTSFGNFNGIPMASQWIHSDHVDAGHHMRLQVYDFDGKGDIQLAFDLNSAVFTPETAKEVPAHFIKLIDAFITNRFQPVKQPALIDPVALLPNIEEKDFDFREKSTLELFEEQVRKSSADKIAIQFGDKNLSYSELNNHANQLAHFLIKNGLQSGENVVVYLPRSPEFVISVLAILKAGGCFVPLPADYPSGRVLGIIEDATAKLVLSNSVLSKKLPADKRLIKLDKEAAFIQQHSAANLEANPILDQSAYIIYTSGSTGMPKGVVIEHRALSHYIQWAAWRYSRDVNISCPLFTSVGFDLTITSLFLPLIQGGQLVTYQEAEAGPDLSLFKILDENNVNFIKLTPSHLALLTGKTYANSAIQTMVVGGENFKTDLASSIQNTFSHDLRIYNEYGPTEATVGCIVHLFDKEKDSEKTSVPIGLPIANTALFILDEFQNSVPAGVIGELYISGVGLAKGYWNQETLTTAQFIKHPTFKNKRLYKSGDLVRLNLQENVIEYLGRKDQQVKISGRRIELAEIETVLNQHPNVVQGIVALRHRRRSKKEASTHNCVSCGLPSNYPSATFNEEGVCHLCQNFDSYQAKVQQYFKTKADLRNIFDSIKDKEEREYDCIMLLSGGKDSTYALAQLKDLGLKVLAFTLDNGYISEEALANVTRVVTELDVDNVVGKTEAMNEIFVDSLQRHCNVCDGCFKTIYTLSIQIALEKNIPFIVTGLSRGQFFETRLTEELFQSDNFDPDHIDEVILNARKSYHQVDDAVNRLLDVSMFEDEAVFEKVRFLDFYRYTDVSLEEMMTYLNDKLPWERPKDTGRSTNCLINQAGIYVHKKELGYSNYAFPYSWDVRIGHKTREASLEEINEEIDEPEVLKILEEIGYTEQEIKNEKLVAYYTGEESTNSDFRNFLLSRFPDYMVPVQFIHLQELPMTINGKIDRTALPLPDAIRPDTGTQYTPAQTEFEEIIQAVWTEVLEIDKIGIHDKFLELGGDSLSGIRVMARLSNEFDLELPVNLIFNKSTIAQLAVHIETLISQLLEELEKS